MGSALERLAAELVEDEPDARRCLPSFLTLVDPAVGVVRSLRLQDDYFNDEPKFPVYRAELAPTRGLSDGGYAVRPALGGRSLEHDRALTGALFEAVERYCLSVYRDSRLVTGSYGELSRRALALDPVELASAERDAAPLRRAALRWTTGWSYRHGREILVPAQAVYLPYAFAAGEPVLRDPLTTGAASGLSRGAAVLRGLLECVERDATTIVHYRGLRPPRLRPEDSDDAGLRALAESLERYGLRLTLHDFTLDLPVPVVAAKVVDPSGRAPAATVGAKASFDHAEAAKGAIFEAACFRRPMRDRRDHAREQALPLLEDFDAIETGELRSYLWVQPEMVRHLDYLDGSRRLSAGFARRGRPTERGVLRLLEAVIEKAGDLIVVDVVTPEIAAYGIKVVKVLAPGLQPMHLCEPDRCWTRRMLDYGGRIGVEKLNPVPHPFL